MAVALPLLFPLRWTTMTEGFELAAEGGKFDFGCPPGFTEVTTRGCKALIVVGVAPGLRVTPPTTAAVPGALDDPEVLTVTTR